MDLHIIPLKFFYSSWVPEVTKLPWETSNIGCLWGVEPLVAKGDRWLETNKKDRISSCAPTPLLEDRKAIWGQGWTNFFTQDYRARNSLVVQSLGLCTLIAKGPGSNPSRRTKIPQAEWHGQKQTNKKNKKGRLQGWTREPKRYLKIRREKSCCWVENQDQKGNSRSAYQRRQKQLLVGVVQNLRTKPRDAEEHE